MWFYEEGHVIDEAAQFDLMRRAAQIARDSFTQHPRRVLLLPPDITRYHSGSGQLTNMLYRIFTDVDGARVDVMPTLGQHVPHTPEQNTWMFGDIPQERILVHRWIEDEDVLGEIPAEFVAAATGGLADWPIPVTLNRAIRHGDYDIIINIGQVVPHEVLGMANHNKNYFIGIGGKQMITASHITAALCGIENNLGQLITPVRGCYNYAEATYLADVPDFYIQIVKTRDEAGDLQTTGLYVGDDVDTYIQAARYAREHAVFLFDEPIHKVVCYMDPREFHATWVANKAVYRTRKVIADGGELLIIAPGVERFGEQEEVDRMIRRHGYPGTEAALAAYRDDPELHDLAHAAAHLIHGSTEGRFTITYAPGGLSAEEIESVGYQYADCAEMMAKYDPENRREGFHEVDGERFYFIPSPSLGLWTDRGKFIDAMRTNQEFTERMIALQPDAQIWRDIARWNDEDLAAFETQDA